MFVSGHDRRCEKNVNCKCQECKCQECMSAWFTLKGNQIENKKSTSDPVIASSYSPPPTELFGAGMRVGRRQASDKD